MKASFIGNFDSFYKAFLIVGGIVAWSLPAWNLIINPYQIFNQTFSIGEPYTSPATNERFLKVNYLLKNAKNLSGTVADTINNGHDAIRPVYDAYIIGSSIMGVIDPGLLKPYFPEERFYNLSFFAAKPDEILSSLQALKTGGVPINTIVYGLDPITFIDIKSYGPAYRLHPMATKDVNFGMAVFDYLFEPSLYDSIGQLSKLISGVISVRYDIEGTGMYRLERYEAEIKSDHKAFIKKQFNQHWLKTPSWINNRFDELGKLTRWLKAEKVKAVFYLSPLHPFYIAQGFGKKRLDEFKQRIVDITGMEKMPDCTYLLVGDDANHRFYDYKHFRASEAYKVVDCGLKSLK